MLGVVLADRAVEYGPNVDERKYDDVEEESIEEGDELDDNVLFGEVIVEAVVGEIGEV